MSTRHHRVDERFAELLAEDYPGIPLPTIESTMLGWAAKHPTESPKEPREGISRNRKRRAEGYGTPAPVGRSLRPVEDIAVGLGRIAS